MTEQQFHPWGKADPKPDPKRFVRAAVKPVEGREARQAERVAWQSFGCAVCGQVARIGAEPGWTIEMHHTVNRSQGGHDSPLLGLCGAFFDNACHWRVTNMLLILERKDVGWVWRDTKTGETGLCRVLDHALAAETGLSASLAASDGSVKDRVWKRRPIPQVRAEMIAAQEGIDVAAIVSGGMSGAESRFNVARELNHRAQRAWMSLAIVIQKSLQMGDPPLLGFETQEEWADAIGIDVATFSKLKLVGRQFAGRWEALAEADKQSLSLEGLYIAARMTKLGHWSEDEALSEAVAQPVHKLYRSYRETVEITTEGAERERCPTCGSYIRPSQMQKDPTANAEGPF